MACHLRVASDTASFGQPEVKLGIGPGYGGTVRLPAAGRPGPRARAAAHRRHDRRPGGLAHRAGEPRRAGRPAARRIRAPCSGRSWRTVRWPFGPAWSWWTPACEMALDEALRLEANCFGLLSATADMREGTRAFLEKRKAAFTGYMSLQFHPATGYFSMIPGRAFRWVGGGSRLLIGCGTRDRLTFPSREPGRRRGSDHRDPPARRTDTAVVEGDLLIVQGRSLDPDGVDTVYFEVGGVNQGFAPIPGEGTDTVAFALQLSTIEPQRRDGARPGLRRRSCSATRARPSAGRSTSSSAAPPAGGSGVPKPGRPRLRAPRAGVVARSGANAQGKTNLLEAIYYPVLFRSFRGAPDQEVARFDGPRLSRGGPTRGRPGGRRSAATLRRRGPAQADPGRRPGARAAGRRGRALARGVVPAGRRGPGGRTGRGAARLSRPAALAGRPRSTCGRSRAIARRWRSGTARSGRAGPSWPARSTRRWPPRAPRWCATRERWAAGAAEQFAAEFECLGEGAGARLRYRGGRAGGRRRVGRPRSTRDRRGIRPAA